MAAVSIIIPAYNEESAISETIESVRRAFDSTSHTVEIIVVDDCSDDDTAERARATGVRVISHPTNAGYGNSLLTGIRNSEHPWIGITDADGTYPVDDLPSMVEEAAERDLDMLVGARQGKYYRGSSIKWWGRLGFKFVSEFAVGRRIPDINSGLRIMRRDMVERYAPVLSGGFSFTTTITIIAFLNYHFVDFRPISYNLRIGTSHVRYWRDTLRAAQVIVMAILFFNPIKLFILQAAGTALAGLILILLGHLIPPIATGAYLALFLVLAVSILLALGFLAEQRRIQHTGIVLPRRGFAPSDPKSD